MASNVSINKLIDDLQTEIDAAKVSRLRGGQWRAIMGRIRAVERSIGQFLHIPLSP